MSIYVAKDQIETRNHQKWSVMSKYSIQPEVSQEIEKLMLDLMAAVNTQMLSIGQRPYFKKAHPEFEFRDPSGSWTQIALDEIPCWVSEQMDTYHEITARIEEQQWGWRRNWLRNEN